MTAPFTVRVPGEQPGAAMPPAFTVSPPMVAVPPSTPPSFTVKGEGVSVPLVSTTAALSTATGPS
ncbi:MULTISPECIES: hypothetical protein [unclassified Xanthobacter]|uniref:hypothetical protein n=1 Tax=unclassified Xanthobacter TaxID=2623496 RepID=UPI001F3AFBC5|nr:MULTISPECIES: hypothetical protein [unclassified Xanthobacter]